MQYFLTADPKDMSQGALSQRVRFLKRDEKGRDRMCEVTDLFWRSGFIKGIHLLKQVQALRAQGKTQQEIAKELQISQKDVALMLK